MVTQCKNNRFSPLTEKTLRVPLGPPQVGHHSRFSVCSQDTDMQTVYSLLLSSAGNQLKNESEAGDEDESVSCYIMHHYFQTCLTLIFQFLIYGAGPLHVTSSHKLTSALVYVINYDTVTIRLAPVFPGCVQRCS